MWYNNHRDANGNGNTEKYEYTNNRLVKKTDRMGAVEEYVYNGYGEIAELKAPGYTEGTTISTKYAYDKAGRLTTVTMADDSKVGYTYDLTGNVLTQTDGEDNVTEYTYYPFGRVKSKTDAEGNEESYVYDIFGNITKKTDGNGVVVSYTYDAKNNLTGVTDGDKINIVYSYDKMNNRKSMLDGTGSSYTYVYNARGQVTGVKYGSADYVQYTYDNAGNTTSYKNVLLGSETAYTYDALNRVLTAGPEDYVYDANGNIVELNSSDGMWMTYTYDKNNRVTKMTNQPLNLFSETEEEIYPTETTYPKFTYVYEYYYNGFEKSKTDFNGTVSYTYDAVGRLSEVTDSATGATRKYDYDKAGNRTKLTETFANNSSGNTTFMGSEISYTSRVAEYEYSVVNTLKVAKDSYTTNTNGVATRITEYEYDKVGNEVSSTASYATSGEVTFNVIDGKDGGVIDSCVEYTINEYDGLNRLVYVNSIKNTNCDEATYTYNGDGLRVKSIVKGVTTGYQDETKYYHYNGNKLTNISKNAFHSTTGMTEYVAGAMGYSAVREDGQTLVYVKNAHGDVNATVNATGNVVDLYAYDEFGNADYIVKNTDNRILYAGEYLDTETGNYYLKARYYNPNIGRFTQRDPHWTPENMIYGDARETAPEPDVRSSDYAVYVPKPIQRQAMVLPTDNEKQKDDKVRGIIAETMAFGEGASYNGSLYESYFAGFGVPEENSLFAIIYAQQADNGAILQSTNLYVYCTNNPVMYVDPTGEVPVDTILDFASLGWSLWDFMHNPSLENFGYLAWDAVALVTPYAPGSYISKADDLVEAGTKILSSIDNYKDVGVWTMGWSKRGYEIEKALGGMGNNFPKIDKYVKDHIKDGVNYLSSITSIKSINITNKSYLSGNTLYTTLKKYVDDVAYFGKAAYKSESFDVLEDADRILEIAIPPVEMNASQIQHFESIMDYAEEKGVQIIIRIVE